MTPERKAELDENDQLAFTAEETAAGWHRCPSWDNMVIGPDGSALQTCECEEYGHRREHTVNARKQAPIDAHNRKLDQEALKETRK